jgi:hypothetical protein
LRDRLRPSSARGTTVKDDWCACLPVQKSRVFDAYVQHLEALYAMMSVSLNEAIDFRNIGRITKANQAVYVVGELCPRLTKPLGELLGSLADHAKHYGTIPNTEPLDPANFQGPKGQHSARVSGLLCLILLSQRAQFLHKTDTLQEMVDDLGDEFQEAAGELADGTGITHEALWRTLDADHFDLNTCLREAIVLLKSFLVALPEDQLMTFQKDFAARLGDAMSFPSSQRRHLRHRRIAQFAGE